MRYTTAKLASDSVAAIIPHLEVQSDAQPIERAYDVCVGSFAGLGKSDPACPAPQAVLADLHAGLLGMVFVRDPVFESLLGRQFVVRPGDAEGKKASNVFLILDEPIGYGPPWGSIASPNVRQYRLLSWTSKMNAPSWSLPAGSPQIGGSCPGAVAGQSVVPETSRRAAERFVNIGLGRPPNTPVDLTQAICQRCYATGGQYSTGNVQVAQILRYLWARQAIDFHLPNGSTAFIETMIYAIDHADYKLDGGTLEADPETGEPARGLPPEPTRRRFFRIHDSGDFFNEEYLRQWKVIADRLPDITFWAPSRIWATSWGVEAVNEINRNPRNLIIRPSAYEVNEPGPVDLGPGWASPATVIARAQDLGMTASRELYVAEREHRPPRPSGPDPRYTWSCRAYSTSDQKHTCRRAVAPPGLGGPDGKGCRACWIAPDEIINYAPH